MADQSHTGHSRSSSFCDVLLDYDYSSTNFTLLLLIAVTHLFELGGCEV